MFGIGFWEIVLIGVVALIVVGPDKFPGMVKNVGYWLGRFREMATNVKQEFKHEIDRAEHLRTLVEEQKDILLRHSVVDETKPTVPIQGIPPSATPSPSAVEAQPTSVTEPAASVATPVQVASVKPAVGAPVHDTAAPQPPAKARE